MLRSLKALIVALLLPGAALAQQVTSFPAANLPLSGAEVLYLVQNGQSKQTPVSTLTNSGSFSALSANTLSVTGTASLGVTGIAGKLSTLASATSGAGLNIAPGTAPTSCVAGDVWITTSGMFACPTGGNAVGPFGSGGGVNNSTQNYLGYYASTGNTLSGLASANSSVLITSNSGVPSWSTTLPAGLTIPSHVPTIKNYANTAALPTVTSANSGEIGYVVNCQNGTEGSGLGTGCLYTVNANGTWTPLPSIPTGQITVGGQALNLGSATSNQGTGSKIQTSSGTATSGHCVQFDSTGATIDAGAACGSGGSGGSGTVTSATQYAVAYYNTSGTGTSVAGTTPAANAVLITSGSNVPSLATTLPSGLTYPTPTVTGTMTAAIANFSGKVTHAASTTAGAGINIGQGTAPTTPVNGDLWITASGGLMWQSNGTTSSGVGTVTSVVAGTGLTGGTITTSGTLAVNVGTSASQIVQLNGSAQLPAVSGVNLTALNASNISSGTLAAAEGGTGLTAFTRTGNTTVFATASGTFTAGDCLQINSSGNVVDAGSACGSGGSGSGTVTSSAANSLAYYGASGTTVTGLTPVNSAVLITSSSGVPSEATTLPSALTIPTPTITGTLAAAAANFSGKLTTAASATGGAGINIGQGVAPSAPVNGDIWINSSGALVWQGGGATQSGVGTVTSVICGTGLTGGTITTSGTCAVNLGTGANQIVQLNGSGFLPAVNASLLTNLSATAITSGALSSAYGGTGLTSFTRNGTTTAFSSLDGATTGGHCVQFDASGGLLDSGGACAGGGVTSGTVNQLAYYSATGSSLAGLSTANNGVLVTSASGAPSISTTLPASLSATTMTLISPAISGTATYSAMTGSGKLTTAATSAANAGLNIPPGTAPTSPANGDIWSTTSGVYVRVNGVTQGPLSNGSGTVTTVATSSPITGGTITTSGTIGCPTCALTTNGGQLTATSPTAISAAGVITCPSCVTSSGGGALTATSPIAVSAAGQITCATCATVNGGGALTGAAPITVTNGAISLANQTAPAVLNWDSSTTVPAYVYTLSQAWPYASGSIVSVTYLTGGTGSPSFNLALQINGVNVATCNGLTVSNSTATTTTCGSNSISQGNTVSLITSAVVGSPSSAVVQVNFSRSGI